MKIQAVCSDIDGTLLDSQRALSARTIAVIHKISREVPVILASSRMPGAMRHLQRELGIEDHPMICFNGGYVIVFEGNSADPVVMDSVRLPLSIGRTIVELSQGTNIHISFFVEDEWYTALNDQWTEREARITKVLPTLMAHEEVMDKLTVAKPGIHKIMCMGPEAEIKKMYSALQARFFHKIHVYRSKPTYLEIAPKAISKASALSVVMNKMFNTDLSGVMAFGDNYNDVELIRAVGRGIAVGNAIPEVRAVADEVTLNSKEDGVAIALEKYFF
jgi:Cof subfamily protein (haloacid dehalogenase superfamily)